MPSKQDLKVNFFFDEVVFTLRNRKKTKKFIEHIFKIENTPLKLINYIFTTDTALLKINKKYLNHNYYTDIITFNYSEEAKPIIADVYISIDRVRENAVNNNSIGFSNELYRVIFHGALHLCGYRDKSKLEIAKMRKKEDQYLKRYKLECFT